MLSLKEKINCKIEDITFKKTHFYNEVEDMYDGIKIYTNLDEEMFKIIKSKKTRFIEELAKELNNISHLLS